MKTHNKETLKDIRRNLRQEMTPAEEVLWRRLRNRRFLGLKFTRQHSIGNYIVDFCCSYPRIIIEVDGAVHLEEEQRNKDIHRDLNLREMGYKVVRFTNDEVINNTMLVLNKLEEALKSV